MMGHERWHGPCSSTVGRKTARGEITMQLTVFMIQSSTLLVLAACWLTGATTIVALFLLNHRRILNSEHHTD